jgi:hypothetical protein
MTAIYRIEQFVRAAGAWVRPEDLEDVRDILSPPELSLFEAMPRYDRRHGIAVLHMLQAQGHAEPELLVAALLHDLVCWSQSARIGRVRGAIPILYSSDTQPSAPNRLARQDAGPKWSI